MCAHQHEVQNDCRSLCRGSGDTAKAIHLTGGGLLVFSDPKEKSAEAILATSNELVPTGTTQEVSQGGEGPNVTSLLIQ